MISTAQVKELTVAQLCARHLTIPETKGFKRPREICWDQFRRAAGLPASYRAKFRLLTSAVQIYTWPQGCSLCGPDWFMDDAALLESLPGLATISDIWEANLRRSGQRINWGNNPFTSAAPDSTSFLFRDHFRPMVAESPEAVPISISILKQEKTMFDFNAPATQVVTLIYGVPAKDVSDQQLLELIQKASAKLDAQREATAKLRKTKMVTAMLAKLEAELDVLLVEADKRG